MEHEEVVQEEIVISDDAIYSVNKLMEYNDVEVPLIVDMGIN